MPPPRKSHRQHNTEIILGHTLVNRGQHRTLGMVDENFQQPEPDPVNPTLFGYPVELTLMIGIETVDVTHAMRWDGENLTVDQDAVKSAIDDVVLPSSLSDPLFP